MKLLLRTIQTGLILFVLASGVVLAQKAEPLRIKFAKGKSSATVSGTLSNDQEMDYVFGATAGQTITLRVSSVPKGNLFDFHLAGDAFEIETDQDYYTNYTFKAPETGDYFVFVRKRPTESVRTAKFLLTLTIR